MLKKIFKNLKTQAKSKKDMSDEKVKVTDEQEVLETNTDNSEAVDNQEIEVDELTEMKQQIGEAKDKYLRLYAEFENYKRRMIRERADNLKRAGQDTMTAILPILDDFDRAEANTAADEDAAKIYGEGVGLIVQKLRSALKTKGLEEMETTEQDFDAELHEAVAELPMGEDKTGKIIDTVEKGYKLNGVIIRHAKVVVGK